MSSLVDRFRSGAGKAAFEADKLRRITAIRTNIRSLEGSYRKELSNIGQVAMSLFAAGYVAQPELADACRAAQAIQEQINVQEQEIERIQAEEYETAPMAQTQFGRICPNGHGPIPPQDNFCQKCGAQAIFVTPPTVPAQVEGAVCQNCGTRLAPGARFCAGCGKPVPVSSPPPQIQSVPRDRCPACGAELLPGAMFCAECGHRVSSPEPPVDQETEIAAIAELDASDESPTGEFKPIFSDPDWDNVPGPTAEPLPSVESAPKETQEKHGEEARTDDSPEIGRVYIDFAVEPSTDAIEPAESALEVGEPPSQEMASEVSDVSFAAFDQPEMGIGEAEDLFVSEDLFPHESEGTVSINSMADDQSCPACGAMLLPDAVFCAECGHRVAQLAGLPDTPSSEATTAEPNTCPSCGAPLLPDAIFCAECGHRVG
jgi:uncharacterized OB-fold protein